MKLIQIAFLIVAYFLIKDFNTLSAQNFNTVYPREYNDALRNPYKGFRPNLQDRQGHPYAAIVRDYIQWSEIENDANDGVQKIIDFCNQRWEGLEKENVKVIPRVYVDWDRKEGNEYWPQDIVDELGWPTWDERYWRSDLVKERIEKLIYKLGEAWDNDPRVAWVQTGLIGYWGEQENPVGVDEEGYVKLMGEAFENAFKNKKLIVRNQQDWDAKGYDWGVYWDSYGHPGQKNGAWKQIQETTAQERYLTQIVEGEVAYNWGLDVFKPLYGNSPTETLGSDVYTNNMIDVIRELHCTGLGWIARYYEDGTDGTDPDKVRENASLMQKAFGYRFVLFEFSCSSRIDQGNNLEIKFKVQNTGSAPFYFKWETAFVLIDESTHDIVWKKVLPGVDCRDWHPGKDYNYDSHQYDFPAPVYNISKLITVPDSVKTAQYMAGITILEPNSGTPGVFFAIENFLKKSQAQPLCRIGIGEDLRGSHKVDASLFADPLYDDARYYSLIPHEVTSSITGNTPDRFLEYVPADNNNIQMKKTSLVKK